MTEVSKIREYQVYQDQVARSLRSNMDEAMAKAREARMPVHRTVARQYDHHHFACHILANALQAQAIIYMMIPIDKSFETMFTTLRKKYIA